MRDKNASGSKGQRKQGARRSQNRKADAGQPITEVNALHENPSAADAENQQAQLRPAKIQGNKPRRRRGRSSRKPAAKPDATSDNN